jgi:hypothetical protein
MFKAPDISRRPHPQPFDGVEFAGSLVAALLLVCGGMLGSGYASVLGEWLLRQ